jgi:8-oxo-dGTP pyrophosphatase MutT (NUDIX family)
VRAIARMGLHYTEDPFDRDRFERLLTLAAQSYADVLAIEPEPVRERFLREVGSLTPKVGADAAVFDDDGRILLVHRVDDRCWGLIAGWVEVNESPAQTVIRELQEELGVAGTCGQLVGVFHRPAGARFGPHAAIGVVYLCTIASTDFRLQEHEILDVGWFDIEDVRDWHANHEVHARAAREAWWRVRTGH